MGDTIQEEPAEVINQAPAVNIREVREEYDEDKDDDDDESEKESQGDNSDEDMEEQVELEEEVEKEEELEEEEEEDGEKEIDVVSKISKPAIAIENDLLSGSKKRASRSKKTFASHHVCDADQSFLAMHGPGDFSGLICNDFKTIESVKKSGKKVEYMKRVKVVKKNVSKSKSDYKVHNVEKVKVVKKKVSKSQKNKKNSFYLEGDSSEEECELLPAVDN